MDKMGVLPSAPEFMVGLFWGVGQPLKHELSPAYFCHPFRAPAVCWSLGRTDKVLALMGVG